MKNKVLIISGTAIVSGAEYVLGDYLENNKNMEQIEILHSDVEKVEEYYKKFNFSKIYKCKYLNPVGVVGSGKLNLVKKLLNLFLSFFIFFKILKNKEIKKVLGNNTGDTIYSFYSYLFGKKHINYIHDMIEPNSMIAKSILLFNKFIFKYIAVSNAVKQALIDIGIEENKIEVIYNGLEYNKDIAERDIDKKIVFGFVGNIEDKKNPLEFLDFIELTQSKLNKKIVVKMVYGNILEQNLFDKIKKIINEKNLNIELVGKIKKNKMSNFYSSIDFLVLTSKKDSLPTVILESFNQGIPVIAHSIDGVPEMVLDNKNGFLYNNSDDFEDIINKLKKIDYQILQKNANNTIKDKFSNKIKLTKLDMELFN
jgi:glycosyltransferase involved in cell wall biosynthesis